MAKARKAFCEFFAGIGLVWEGLKASGWDCIYSNDIDPKKKDVFETHFGKNGHFHLEDVWKTDEVVAKIERNPFLATASFPCTDLSLAGYYSGLKGKESSTYFAFLKVLEALGERKPPMIMLENVPSFLTANGGKDFPSAMRALAELGYWIDAFIVDARFFVPQSRPRVFVVGVHERWKSPLMIKESRMPLQSAPWRDAISRSRHLRPAKLVRAMEMTELPTGWFTLGLTPPPQMKHSLLEVIDFGEEQEWWDKEQLNKHYHMMHDYHRDMIDEIVRKRGDFVGTIYRRTRRGAVRAELRCDGIAGCLRTTKGGSARQIVCVVKNGTLRMRWMSPREYARLQGAGNYMLGGGTDNQSMFGFGDAVCVPVIKWVDDNVLTPLFETLKTSKPRAKKAVAASV